MDTSATLGSDRLEQGQHAIQWSVDSPLRVFAPSLSATRAWERKPRPAAAKAKNGSRTIWKRYETRRNSLQLPRERSSPRGSTISSRRKSVLSSEAGDPDAPTPNSKVVKRVRLLKGHGTGFTPRKRRLDHANVALERRDSGRHKLPWAKVAQAAETDDRPSNITKGDINIGNTQPQPKQFPVSPEINQQNMETPALPFTGSVASKTKTRLDSSKPSRRFTDIHPPVLNTPKPRRVSAALDNLKPSSPPTGAAGPSVSTEGLTAISAEVSLPGTSETPLAKLAPSAVKSYKASGSPGNHSSPHLDRTKKSTPFAFKTTRPSRRRTEAITIMNDKTCSKRRASVALDTLEHCSEASLIQTQSPPSLTSKSATSKKAAQTTLTEQQTPHKRVRRGLRSSTRDEKRRKTDFELVASDSPVLQQRRRASAAPAFSLPAVSSLDGAMPSITVDIPPEEIELKSRNGPSPTTSTSQHGSTEATLEDVFTDRPQKGIISSKSSPNRSARDSTSLEMQAPSPDLDMDHPTSLAPGPAREAHSSSTLDIQDLDLMLQPKQIEIVTTTTVKLNDEDTDMLKSFLSRSKASKARNAAIIAERAAVASRRDSGVIKAALASPVRPALESLDANLSPQKKIEVQGVDTKSNATDCQAVTPKHDVSKQADEFDDGLGEQDELAQAIAEEPLVRRSGRTPKADNSKPNTISIRRQGESECVALKKSEAQQLASLTKANTRRNRGDAVPARVMLIRMKNNTTEELAMDDSGPVDLEGRVKWNEDLVAYYQEAQKQEAHSQHAGKDDELGTEEETNVDHATKAGAKRTKTLGAANGTPCRPAKYRHVELDDDEVAFADENQTLELPIPEPAMELPAKAKQSDNPKVDAAAAAKRLPTPAKPRKDTALPLPAAKATAAAIPTVVKRPALPIPAKSLPVPRVATVTLTPHPGPVPVTATAKASNSSASLRGRANRLRAAGPQAAKPAPTRSIATAAEMKGKGIVASSAAKKGVLPSRDVAGRKL